MVLQKYQQLLSITFEGWSSGSSLAQPHRTDHVRYRPPEEERESHAKRDSESLLSWILSERLNSATTVCSQVLYKEVFDKLLFTPFPLRTTLIPIWDRVEDEAFSSNFRGICLGCRCPGWRFSHNRIPKCRSYYLMDSHSSQQWLLVHAVQWKRNQPWIFRKYREIKWGT